MTTSAAEIHVVDTEILAVLLGGEWINVRDVLVSYADYTRTTTGGTTVAAYGLHVAATIRTGPNNGDRIVAPLHEIEALRTS